jgi:hypothetical protein
VVIYGYPDVLLGEYLWIGEDHSQKQKSSTFIAVSHRADSKSTTWDIDLYQIIDSVPWVSLSKYKAFKDLSKAQLESMSFKAGQFIWTD